jgi:hypothetical protein
MLKPNIKVKSLLKLLAYEPAFIEFYSHDFKLLERVDAAEYERNNGNSIYGNRYIDMLNISYSDDCDPILELVIR